MTNKKILAIISTTIASSLFAISAIAQPPSRCPGVGQIVATGLQMVELDSQDNMYLAGSVSQYGTPWTWGFVMGMPINQAADQQDAFNKLSNALKTLKGTPKPTTDRKGHWFCIYSNAYGYLSAALTPINMAATVKTVKSVKQS